METAIIITAALCAATGTVLLVMEIKTIFRKPKITVTEYIPLYSIRKSGGKKRMRLKKKSSRRRLRPTGAKHISNGYVQDNLIFTRTKENRQGGNHELKQFFTRLSALPYRQRPAEQMHECIE